MSSIKNIIFDLGNVILDIDPEITKAAFRKLNKDQAEFEAAYLKNQANQVFERYEVGAITEAEFVMEMQAGSSLDISYDQVIDAWNALLLTTPPKRFEMLQRLGQKYQIFLLSNTNETHLKWVRNYFAMEHQVLDFDGQFFKKAYYSHLIQLRKPNVEIYEFVLKDAELIPSETLFIDDLEENILGANAAGIQTIHHLPGNEIVTILEKY